MYYLPLEFEPSNIFPQESIAIRPDVHITFSNGILPSKTERTAGTTAPIFELSYSRKNAIYGEVSRTPIELKPGHASLGFLGQVNGHSEYDSGEEVQLYSIWVGPCAFDGFCEAVSGKNNLGFRSFQKGDYYCSDFKSDPLEEVILNKLDTYFIKEGALNKLLLESYILELLSINIERLLCKDCHSSLLVELSKSDINSLHFAREILLDRLESPPSLLELSRLIHMNDCKLKRSFKLYFGKTVYEYIRGQRMEKAFSLLQSGDYNVSQTAFAVGYTNISHFSDGFKKRFGMNPLSLIRAGRLTQKASDETSFL